MKIGTSLNELLLQVREVLISLNQTSLIKNVLRILRLWGFLNERTLNDLVQSVLMVSLITEVLAAAVFTAAEASAAEWPDRRMLCSRQGRELPTAECNQLSLCMYCARLLDYTTLVLGKRDKYKIQNTNTNLGEYSSFIKRIFWRWIRIIARHKYANHLNYLSIRKTR